MKKLAGQYALLSWGDEQRTLTPGSSLTIGRHAQNDVVLHEAGVSRFHATVRWREEDPCPTVLDNGSQNGTRVDGTEVRSRLMPVRHGATLSVVSVEFLVQFKNCHESALLWGTTDLVALFTERGTLIEGEFESGSDVQRVLQQLEAERRTGTLHVRPQSLDAGTVTLCQGRVMAAQWGDSRKTRALERLLALGSAGQYRFAADLEPTDDPMGFRFSDYLRARRIETKPNRVSLRDSGPTRLSLHGAVDHVGDRRGHGGVGLGERSRAALLNVLQELWSLCHRAFLGLDKVFPDRRSVALGTRDGKFLV